LISLDPEPRREIDRLCDEVIRERLETVDLDLFDHLEAGDILFIDGSHRCFMDSDVTVAFLDILPRLAPGVIVHFHDIFLPYDYPAAWGERYYSEQYLLACFLLAETKLFRILFPNWFIGRDAELTAVLDPLFTRPEMQGVEPRGGSFWLEIN